MLIIAVKECFDVRFSPGQIVWTPGARAALGRSGESPYDYLRRHLAGDWGEVCEEDREANEAAVEDELRLLSAYPLKNGEKIWVITEADRLVTTLLLPEEY